MTQGPEHPDPQDPTPEGSGDQPSTPDSYSPPPPPSYGQPSYSPPPVGPGVPGAPYGVHPVTGIPYSDKSKIVAGLLQILLPLGIGRFYIGDNKTGVWQLVVTILTCGIGSLWPFIDGIIMLATDSKDAQGRMLRT